MNHPKRRTHPEQPTPPEPRPAGMQAMGEAIYEQIRQAVQELPAPTRPG
ncbi:MAG: hypothetical protein ACYC8T_25255 [Myxococcaceae bacterium]